MGSYIVRHTTIVMVLAAKGMIGQATPSHTSIAGCYTVELGAWSGSFPSGSPTYHQPPSRMRLDTTETTRPTGYYTVTPSIPRLGGRMSPRWRFRAPDTVRVFWSSGFAGVGLTLVVHGDTLRGVAKAFHDVIGPVQPSADVIAVRIPCADSPN